jgi:hypothetical protein
MPPRLKLALALVLAGAFVALAGAAASSGHDNKNDSGSHTDRFRQRAKVLDRSFTRHLNAMFTDGGVDLAVDFTDCYAKPAGDINRWDCYIGVQSYHVVEDGKFDPTYDGRLNGDYSYDVRWSGRCFTATNTRTSVDQTGMSEPWHHPEYDFEECPDHDE